MAIKKSTELLMLGADRSSRATRAVTPATPDENDPAEGSPFLSKLPATRRTGPDPKHDEPRVVNDVLRISDRPGIVRSIRALRTGLCVAIAIHTVSPYFMRRACISPGHLVSRKPKEDSRPKVFPRPSWAAVLGFGVITPADL